MLNDDGRVRSSLVCTDGGTDCLYASSKRLRMYDHERLAEEHQNVSEAVLGTSVKVLKETIATLEESLTTFESRLPESASDVPAFLSSLSSAPGVSELGCSIPKSLARFRRHYRQLTTLASDSLHTLDGLKTLYRAAGQELLDGQLQLSALQKQIVEEQEAVPTPKFNAVLPLLCAKEEFSSSSGLRMVDDTDTSPKAPISVLSDKKPVNAVESCCQNVNEEEHDQGTPNGSGAEDNLVVRNLDDQRDVAMGCDEPRPSVADGPVEDLEEFYLSWLNFDLASRAKEAAAIEAVRSTRQAAEEKLKLFQKSETELASKLNPLEKEISRLISTMGHTSASPSTGMAPGKAISPLVFPQKAYSLCPPLLCLFTKLFCYKAVNGDFGVETRLAFQPTGKVVDPLYETDPGRLQIVIDKAATLLPPSTFPKAAALFPLSIRFCYFPKLNIISAMCQFPRVIGSDVTFLADLLFPNDEGTISPNPLHHIATDTSQLFSFPDAVPTLTVVNADEPQGLARAIASRISELQLGRPYRWAHLLADVKFNVDAGSVASLATPVYHEKGAPVTAGHFVKRFRLRASHRAWTLYIEESLKENPHAIPPAGVTIPPDLEASSVVAASMYHAFSSSSATEFRMAGGSLSGVAASKDRDVHFLKAELKVRGVVFSVFMAVPLDTRPPDVCFYVKSLPADPAEMKRYLFTPQCFSLVAKADLVVKEDLPPSKRLRNVLSLLKSDERQRVELYAGDVLSLDSEHPDGSAQPQDTQDARDAPAPSQSARERCDALLTFLGTLYPASAQMPLASEQHSSPNSSSLEDLRRSVAHFCEPSLSAIQETVTSAVPAAYLTEPSSAYSHVLLVIQLVSLATHLDRWVRDVVARGHLP